MAYGLKYQTQFTSQSDVNNPEKDYRLQFLFKDYTGASVSVIGGDISVVQRCTVDDPVAPVKGQSLDISLVNKGGSLPITAFQSEADDAIQVKLLDENDNVLFIGYTVQDDFYEIMVDYEHSITLSANDSLGLLKGVPLSEAESSRRYSVVMLQYESTLDEFYISTDNPSCYPTVNGTIEILGVTYTFLEVTQVSVTIGAQLYNWLVKVTPDTPGWGTAITETITLTGPLNLLNRNRIIDIISACLSQTNLSLITNIFHNLYAYQQASDRSTWEYTLLDSQMFISGDTYQDCYTVLETIMESYNCQIFQANGQWNIINWHEARQYGNSIPCFIYDETFAYLGNGVFSNIFNVGPDPQLTRPLFGLNAGFIRGYKFSKKKFEYKQPKQLLKNHDLQILGSLRSQYLNGTTRISEYEAPFFQLSNGTPIPDRFIRVEYDTVLQREIERYLVVRGQGYNDILTLPCEPIEFNTDDRFNFSCSFRTNVSGIPGTVFFGIQLNDGATQILYLDSDNATPGNVGQLTWGNGYCASVFYAGEDSIEWHQIDTSTGTNPTPRSPKNGLLTVFFPTITDPPQGISKESHFKDIQFTYIPQVNDTVLITGQVHTQTQPPDIKNNSDKEIQIDDTPRNSIQGTILRNTKTGLVQDRTDFWRYPASSDGWRLGERTTLQDLLWRQRTRSKLEGGFVGNYQSDTIISLLTLLITDFNPTKIYTFGLMTIDYKKNQFSGSLWELYDEQDAELDNTYELKYLYSTT